MSTADTYVRARIDTNTKERATEALAAMGLSISDAIRLLMLRVAAGARLAVTADGHVVGPTSLVAWDDNETSALELAAQIDADERRLPFEIKVPSAIPGEENKGILTVDRSNAPATDLNAGH